MPPPALPALVAIFGPTASGKSALAIELCEAFRGEIVTADSRQVYRYMNIGTDKPGPAQRARVPHHMIDLVDPDESYTLATYQEQAFACIDDIHRRGKLPVLAGGTPLYVNSVVEGWVIPRVEPDPAFRAALEDEAARLGSERLHRRLLELDPAAASTILPTNARRIIRALEVIHQTGRPMSAQQGKATPPYAILEICLQCDRSVLYGRIDARVDGYIDAGLVDEVISLHERGYNFGLPAMSGIGYRQIGEYLQGRATLPEAILRIKWDTHAFVRHQVNWFRRAANAEMFDVTNAPATAEVLSRTGKFLSFASA
jgi:tRNA dimethylallyltransferase